MTMEFAFNREQQEAIGSIFDEKMNIPVSIEVWAQKDSVLVRPDREPSPHSEDVIRLARLVASLHPALTVTLYDLDRHASRAAEAGITRAPVTMLRGRNGRDVRIVGFWTGALFPAVVDVITYLSSEETPFSDPNKAALAKIDSDLHIEMYGAIYDQLSSQMMRYAGALAVESRHLRVQFTELVEFPSLALARDIDSVPVTMLGQLRFNGVWDEDSLVRQIAMTAQGDPGVVTLPQQVTVPYYSEADIERMAAANAEVEQAPPQTPSGLYLPG